MRNAALALTLSIVVPGLIVAACKKKEEEPPPQQGGYGQPGYGQPGYGQPQPGYGQPQPGYAGAPGAAGAPAGTAAGQPAPMAFPCSNDATCGLHKCNMTAGRCQWPCQTNEDCQAGAACMTPFCMPGGGAAPAPTR